MRMADAGWIWEGQGLDPGVHPSIFGVGEGADYFGLSQVHFIFHPADDFSLRKLSGKRAVSCDISKWKFRDCGEGGRGSECYNDSGIAEICAEAENVSRLSLQHRNIVSGFFDDMKGLMAARGHGPAQCEALASALRKHNPALQLECVVYSHEVDDAPGFWEPLKPYIDVVSFWVWGYQGLADLEQRLARCRRLFPDKPIVMGCYLRDYPTAAPMPMDALRHQWSVLATALEDGRVAGFDILGTVLIDGQQEQAAWVRDFIRDH